MKKITKQLILHLRRLLKAKEITERDVCQYFKKTIEKLLYKGKHNSIIRRKTFKNANRVTIRFNVIKSDRQVLKYKAKRRRSLLGWSRRIVLYRKRRRSLERDSKNGADETKLRKLNERLDVYENKSVKHLETNPNITSETLVFETVTDSTQIENISNRRANNNDLDAKRKQSLDDIISKLKVGNKNLGNKANASPAVKKLPVANLKVPSISIRQRDENESSNLFDFFGFNGKDVGAGMLPTRVVPNHHHSLQSAFISERLNQFLRENTLEDRANIELPKVQKIVEGSGYEGAPKSRIPNISNDIGRPRTVAENRSFLERKQSIKYYIVENENTIHCALVDTDGLEREPAIRNGTESDMPMITSVRSLNSINTTESPCQTSTLLPTNCQNLKLKNPGGAVAAERFHQNAIVKLNSAVTKTMQSICAIQKRNSINIPVPAPRTLSSLQWKYFLPAFVNGLVFVWKVCVNGRTIIVVTKKNVMPQIPDAVSAINIRALPRDKLPLIGKMLIDDLLTDKIKMLSVLMSGYNGYWHIVGFLNSQQDYLTQCCMILPKPETHPRLSSTVNALYNLLFLREMNLLTNRPTAQFTNHDTNTNLQAVSPQPTVISTAFAWNQGGTSPSSQATCGIPISQLPRSNLAIRSYVQKQNETVVIPIPITGGHYWLMLNIFDDFSHIYIPEWNNFLGYDQIREALTIASSNKTTVRLGKIIDNVDIYATSCSNYYIYIGPFYEQREPNLVLYQNVDGRMMLREDFEKSRNIKRINNTVGYWLRIRNSTLIYVDIPTTSAAGNESEASRKRPIYAEHVSSASDNSCSLLAPTEPPPAKRPNITRDVPRSSGSAAIGVGLFQKEVLKNRPPTSLLGPEMVKQPTLPVMATSKITAARSSPDASNTIKSVAVTNSKGISQTGMLNVTKSGRFLHLAPNMTPTSGFAVSSVNKPTNVNTASTLAFATRQPPLLASLKLSSLPNDSNMWKPSTSSIDSETKRNCTSQISHLTGSQAKMSILRQFRVPQDKKTLISTTSTSLGSSFAASTNSVATNINDVSTSTMTTTTTATSLGKPTNVNTASALAFAAQQPTPLLSLQHSSLPNDSKSTTLTSIDSGAKRKGTQLASELVRLLTSSQPKKPTLQRPSDSIQQRDSIEECHSLQRRDSIQEQAYQRRESPYNENQSGFFISDFLILGKVPAEKRSDGYYFLKFSHHPVYMKFSNNPEHVDRYLTHMVKQVGQTMYGNCTPMNWRFVTTNHSNYEVFDLQEIRRLNSKYNSMSHDENPNNELVESSANHSLQIPVNIIPKFTKITDFSPKAADENNVVISKLPRKTYSKTKASSSPSSLLVPKLQHARTVSEVILIDD